METSPATPTPGDRTTLRDERALTATLELHEFESLGEASEFVLVRDASDAELQSAWDAYQLNRGRGWN